MTPKTATVTELVVKAKSTINSLIMALAGNKTELGYNTHSCSLCIQKENVVLICLH